MNTIESTFRLALTTAAADYEARAAKNPKSEHLEIWQHAARTYAYAAQATNLMPELGRAIKALRDTKRHTPYIDSHAWAMLEAASLLQLPVTGATETDECGDEREVEGFQFYRGFSWKNRSQEERIEILAAIHLTPKYEVIAQ
jgi:hypothetical protein